MARTSSNGQINTALTDLVWRIHANPAGDAHWSGVLDMLRAPLSARFVILGRHRFSSADGIALCDAPHNPEFCATYAAYAARNPWFLSSQDYIPGRVMRGEDLVGAGNLLRTDFYQRLLKPHGLLHALCGVLALRSDVVHYISAFRGDEQESFGERDKSTLNQVLPHFTLALEHQWRVRQADDLAKAMTRIVDHHAHPTFLIGRSGRVVYRNKRAESFSLGRLGVCIEAGHVRAIATTDDKILKEAIHGVLRESVYNDSDVYRVVSFATSDGQFSTVLTVRPAGRLFRADEGEAEELVLLTLRDAHSEHDPNVCAFARQFSLTPAQSRVSALVFCGHSLGSVAHLLNVSENTVRSHLKQVFEKTSTHGQLELVHLHARLCGSDG
jgi:DNA-binding CsgD family transcriptional regulator